MSTTTLFYRLRQELARFGSARGGNVVVTFTIMLLPILGAIGAAVDYSNANSVKTAMQAAVDSTALMLSKEVASLSSTQLTQKGTDYFKALFRHPEVQNVAVTPTYAATSSTLSVAASGTTKTNFMAMMGFKQLSISASSTVKWGTGKIEIALVLDNTGSMLDNGKFGALKTASHQLLDTLQKSAASAGDVKVAIIPFTTQVNIGTAYKTATWIDWTYMKKGGGGGDKCDWDDKEERGDENDKDSWTGGVVDRLEPYNVQDTAPTSDPKTWYPAVNSSLTPIQPLTSNWTALHATIDKMKASGKTNTTIGLVWGLHALTQSEPLTEATPPSANVTKYMVFLTDGENTQDRWTTKAASIDARTKTACVNIKAAGIKLFTVRVMDGNKTLLQSCASDPTMYYEVNNANQMSSVFNKIGGDLKTLYVSK